MYCTERRQQNTITYQPFVPGINHCVEHGLIKEAIAHPFRNDDIYSIHRQLHLFHLSFYNCDNWKQQREYKHFTSLSWGRKQKKLQHGTLHTIVQLVGFHNFHSIIWNAAALNLLKEKNIYFDLYVKYAPFWLKYLFDVNLYNVDQSLPLLLFWLPLWQQTCKGCLFHCPHPEPPCPWTDACCETWNCGRWEYGLHLLASPKIVHNWQNRKVKKSIFLNV